MGAWIETLDYTDFVRTLVVAPYVGAWIETFALSMSIKLSSVAPYVGAWIETILTFSVKRPSIVAPYVGAWIETSLCIRLSLSVMSHPMWVRGLKHPCQIKKSLTPQVAPYVGAWIETYFFYNRIELLQSRTLCGCVD